MSWTNHAYVCDAGCECGRHAQRERDDDWKKRLSEGGKCLEGCQCGRHSHVITEETKRKISSTLTGQSLSEAHRKAIGNGQRGRKLPPRSEEWKANLNNALQGNGLGRRCRDNCQCELHRERLVSIETRRKLSTAIRAAYQRPEASQRRSEANRNRWKDTDWVEKYLNSDKRKGANIRHSEFMKERMNDPAVSKTYLAGWRKGINKAESRLLEILQPYGFVFVGDGSQVIAGKWPDFWDGGTKVIELFGDYWHRNDDPQRKIQHFKEHGYACLIIWESQLNKTPDQVRELVEVFA